MARARRRRCSAGGRFRLRRRDDEAATPAAPPAETGAPADTGGAAASEPAAAGGLGSQFDVASAGDVTLKIWWLGDLEAPGIEKWLGDMVTTFQTQYPNVKVEPTLYDVNTWVQTQATACQSKSGPDLWYNWSGTWSLEPAWKGCTVPNEEVVSSDDIAANPSVQETAWEGKTWDFPLYKFVYPVVVNLDLLDKAGVDPTSMGTWDGWMAGLEKIKAAGITPLALGLKDGFGGEIAAAGQFEKQWVNTPDDIKQLVIDGDFATDPGWTAMARLHLPAEAVFQRGRELAYVRRRARSLAERQDRDGLRRTGRAGDDQGGPGCGHERGAAQDGPVR